MNAMKSIKADLVTAVPSDGTKTALPAPTDADRLNWLQERRETVYVCSHQEWKWTTEAVARRRAVYVFDGWAVHQDQEPKPTIREAIDAAMLAQSRLESATRDRTNPNEMTPPSSPPEVL